MAINGVVALVMLVVFSFLRQWKVTKDFYFSRLLVSRKEYP